MGMFNWIEVRGGVPEEIQGADWQTKDVEPNLCDLLKITDNGYLLRRLDVLVEDEDRPMGIKKEPLKWVHLCNFNGTINMIGDLASGNFTRYEAEFTNGQIDKVRKLK